MVSSVGRGAIRKLGYLLLCMLLNAAHAKPLQEEPGHLAQMPPGKAQAKQQLNSYKASAQLTTVPDFSGRSLAEVKAMLIQLHLAGGKVTIKDPAGVVLSQNPAPNQQVSWGTQVTMVVGTPEIKLTLDNYHPELGTSVTATITLTPQIENARYYFYWGDGNQDIRQLSPSLAHSYQAAQTYTLSVKVLVANTMLPASAYVTVTNPKPPPPSYAMSLEADDPTLEIGSQGKFTAKLTPSPPANMVVEYCFLWADNSPNTCRKEPSDTVTVEHAFNEQGQYHVMAVAVFYETKISSTPLQIDVFKAPAVSLTADTAFPALSQQTVFRIRIAGNLSSNAPLRYCFAWDKDAKEECQDLPEAMHAFTAAGMYSVSAIVEQDHDRFAAKPVLIRVYEVGLTSLLSKAQADKPIHFEAKLSPDSRAKRMKYCFHWGDKTQTCGSASWADHTFTSSGSYLTFVEVFMNDMKIATSNSRVVTIGWPLWLTILVWGAGPSAVSAAVYGIRKAKLSRAAAESSVRVTPHYDSNPQYKVTGPKSPPRCLVRIRWVRSSVSATINPSENLIKKKGSAHV